MDYIFEVPIYHYKINIIHPLLEIYRYNLINNYINELSKKIGKGISIHKIKQYFSQLIMNILSNRTYNKNQIILDDGLLNNCDEKEVSQFYSDINYYYKSNKFVVDQFGIITIIRKMIESIDVYSKHIPKTDAKTYEIREIGTDTYEYILNSTLPMHSPLPIHSTISKSIRNRLKSQYTGPPNEFDDLLFCCLVRYITLGSGANQFMVDLEYKKQLRKKFNLNFECFGSVFNHYYNHYCSMFYDIEKYFGSCGSFMALQITKGFYMANPPYDNVLLHNMYSCVKIALESKDGVAFIMSIPKWENYQLEENIEENKLYYAKKVKKEFFLDPMKNKKVPIPPYISYLFFNKKYLEEDNNKINSLVHYFCTFTNMKGGTENSTFPYRSIIYSDAAKIDIFKQLQKEYLKRYCNDKYVTYPNIKLNNIDYLLNGKYNYLIYDPNKYQLYMLSDLFNDKCRALCTFGRHESPYSYYTHNREKILDYLKKKNLPSTPINIREEIYLHTKECSVHNPLIIKYFIQKYGAKNILDPSSGWGTDW